MSCTQCDSCKDHQRFENLWNEVYTYYAGPKLFTWHLVLSIFWEETAFRNCYNSAGAAGYGQITSVALADLVAFGLIPRAPTKQQIVADRRLPIQLIGPHLSRCLAVGKNKDGALSVYGGGSLYPEAPKKWKACEDALIKAIGPDPGPLLQQISGLQITAIKSALDLAKNGGFSSGLAFGE